MYHPWRRKMAINSSSMLRYACSLPAILHNACHQSWGCCSGLSGLQFSLPSCNKDGGLQKRVNLETPVMCQRPVTAIRKLSRLTMRRKQKARMASLASARQRKVGWDYVVSGRNCNAVLEWMPAHVQDLFIEIDLIRVCFFFHPSTLTARS